MTRRGYISTGMSAVDDMLGGGLLRGSVTIIGGFPGSGKTTLGLQMVAHHKKARLLSSEQAKMELVAAMGRIRPSASDRTVDALSVHALRNLDLVDVRGLDLLVLDTMSSFLAAPHRVAEWAKSQSRERGLTVVLLAHLNRQGNLLGGSRAEHVVDTLLVLNDTGRHGERLLHIDGKHRHGDVDVPPVRMRMMAMGLIVQEDAVDTALN